MSLSQFPSSKLWHYFRAKVTTTHTITVEARGINDRLSMPFAIAVIDVNEFPVGPVSDSDQDTDNEISEDAAASSYTGITLSATDKDGTAIISYTLTGPNNGLFLADTNTGIVTLQGELNYEDSTQHTIIAEAISSATTATFTIAVNNVNEITLTDADPTSNTVIASANAAVAGLTLRAIHADNAAITSWEITAQTDASLTAVDLFELSEPQDSATQTLRIKADANLAPITAPTTITFSISVRTAHDEASEGFDIQVSPEPPADGIRLRIRVYLEGALE